MSLLLRRPGRLYTITGITLSWFGSSLPPLLWLSTDLRLAVVGPSYVDIKETAQEVEHAVQYRGEGRVGAELFLCHIKPGFLEALASEGDIPRLEPFEPSIVVTPMEARAGAVTSFSSFSAVGTTAFSAKSRGSWPFLARCAAK